MNRIKALLLLAVMITGGQYIKVFGQAVTPFNCSELGMIVTIGDNAGSTQFYKFDPTATPSVIQKFKITKTNPSYSTNSAGYNPEDGFIYTFPSTGTATLTTLLRIDADGLVTELPVTNSGGTIPGGGFRGGTIDDNGIYYLAPQSNGSTFTNCLYYIDLKITPYVVHNIPFSDPQARTFANSIGTMGMPDMVWNPSDRKLYGIEVGTGSTGLSANAAGQLNVITLTYNGSGTPTGATLTRPGMNGTAYKNNYTSNPQFGVMFISFPQGSGAVGSMFALQNQTGDFFTYDIDPSSSTYGSRTNTGINFGQTGISVDDGASCPAVNADIMVTKNDSLLSLGIGQSATYSVVVSNAGPSTASNIHVTDSLPEGIPEANMTWALISLSTGATSNFAPEANNTGILSDYVTIPINGSIIYRVTITVPDDYTGSTLVNIASAKLDNFVLDPDLSNNSVYDADRIPPVLPVNPNVRVKIQK